MRATGVGAAAALVLASCLNVTSGAAADAGPGSGPEPREAGAPAEYRRSPAGLAVLFATNRAPEPGDGRAFGNERGSLVYGHCRVDFTPLPLLGEVAERMPFYVPHERVEVEEVRRVPVAAFWSALNEGADPARPVVVFVHGYSFDLEEGCKRSATLQRALGPAGRMVLFSWPSNDNPADYTADRADVEWSVPDLAGLLERLAGRAQDRPLHLVAHSMGARGVVDALLRLDCARDRSGGPVVDQLVLLAPDLDQETFLDLLPHLRPLAQRITLYASDHDTLLTLSRILNGHPRLGEAGAHLTVAEGMQTVDVSPLGRHHVTGHEYYRYHPRVTRDLVELLATGRGAAERSLPEAAAGERGRYWVLREAPD